MKYEYMYYINIKLFFIYLNWFFKLYLLLISNNQYHINNHLLTARISHNLKIVLLFISNVLIPHKIIELSVNVLFNSSIMNPKYNKINLLNCFSDVNVFSTKFVSQKNYSK